MPQNLILKYTTTNVFFFSNLNSFYIIKTYNALMIQANCSDFCIKISLYFMLDLKYFSVIK